MMLHNGDLHQINQIVQQDNKNQQWHSLQKSQDDTAAAAELNSASVAAEQ